MENSANLQHRYVSYLLRIWQTNTPNGTVWRASLEHVGTGQRHIFQDMPQLTAFLANMTVPSDSDGTVEEQ